jgi:hypothetical protein
MAYAMSEEHYARMSESEQEFLTKYINATERLMHDSVLRGLPVQYQSLVSQIGDDRGDDGSNSSFDMSARTSPLRCRCASRSDSLLRALPCSSIAGSQAACLRSCTE